MTETEIADLLDRLDADAAARLRVVLDTAAAHLAARAELVRRTEEAQQARIRELEGRRVRDLLVPRRSP